MHLTAQQIADSCGAPLENVSLAWPLVVEALGQEGVDSALCEIAAAATIATETGNFKPREEHGPLEYFSRYEGNRMLGNTEPGDGYRFRGRGFIQLTGRSNYEIFGRLLGVDLLNHPDWACSPTTAAQVLAAYFRRRGVDKAASVQDWTHVRQKVNGGLNGWPKFERFVKALLEVAGA